MVSWWMVAAVLVWGLVVVVVVVVAVAVVLVVVVVLVFLPMVGGASVGVVGRGLFSGLFIVYV